MNAIEPTPSLAAIGGDPIDRALTRIEFSRAKLRQALVPPPERDRPEQAAGGGRMQRRLRLLLRGWVAGTPLAPLLHTAWAGARGWWQQHPWRSTGVAAGRAVSDELGPLVRRHPAVSIGVAAAVGAAIVAARPWQWPLLAGFALHARQRAMNSTLSWSWRQLSQPWVQMALATALAAWGGSRSASAASADAATQTTPAP